MRPTVPTEPDTALALGDLHPRLDLFDTRSSATAIAGTTGWSVCRYRPTALA
jgi:hypothetical protein